MLGPLVLGLNSNIRRRGVTETLLMPRGQLLRDDADGSGDAGLRIPRRYGVDGRVVERIVLGASGKDRFAHWLLDLVRATRDPLVGLNRSRLAFFGKGHRSDIMIDHLAALERWKETNSVLFVTENDDMPNGSREPSPHGHFGRMPQFLIAKVCALDRSHIATANTRAFSRDLIRAQAFDAVSDQLAAPPEAEPGTPGGAAFVSIVRDATFSPPSHFKLNIDSTDTALRSLTGDYFLDHAKAYLREASMKGSKKKPKPPPTPSPSPLDTRIGTLIADRIEAACRLEEASTTVGAMEAATMPVEHGEDPPSPSCPRGLRYSDAAVEARRARHVATFRRSYALQPRGPPPLPSGQATHNPVNRRHNCGRVPLPAAEVPPAADVHGADLFLDVIRTVVGDCDTHEGSDAGQPSPWEVDGC